MYKRQALGVVARAETQGNEVIRAHGFAHRADDVQKQVNEMCIRDSDKAIQKVSIKWKQYALRALRYLPTTA